MRSVGRRALAVAIVGGVLAVTLVVSAMTVTPNPAHTNGTAKLGSPARIVASIRNTSAQSVHFMLTKVASATCPASVTAAPLVGSFPIFLAAGAQAAVVISTPGFTGPDVMTGQPSCDFDVVETPSTGATIRLTANFSVSTMGTPIEAQAATLSMVGNEIQTVVITSNASSPLAGVTAEITDDPANQLSFAGGSAGCGGHSCAIPSIAVGEGFEVPLACADAATAVGATVSWTSGATTLDQIVTCNPGTSTMPAGEQIALDTTQLAIVSTPFQPQTATTAVTSMPLGNDRLVLASITGAGASVFSFPGLCTGQSCDLSGGAAIALPHALVVGCTPDSTGVRNATLTVTGESGTQATALVRCDGGATGGPVLQVSTPTLVVPGSVPVGMAGAPVAFTMTNAGSGTLTASIAVSPPADAEWQVSGCTTAVPCSLVGHGSATTVEVTLTPTQHGERTGEMVVTSNDPANLEVPINLAGLGRGGFLSVIAPTPPLDFGAIPSTQASEIVVEMLDSGNAPLAVSIAPPAMPFSANVGSVAIAANQGTNTFRARCGPGAPTAGSGDFVLTSAAYNAPMIAVHADCTLVDSDVGVVPTHFDFGELRVGMPPVTLPFAITNLTSHDISLDAVGLASAPDVLALDAPTTPRTLHASESATGSVTLTPTADIAFDRGVALAVTSGTADLALPITGRVVTPHAVVSPVQLDLGTACVGSTVSGTVHLINDGTATLAMDGPTMDEAFVPLYLSPVAYPAPLLAGTQASVEVVPATTAAGSVHGILSWPVDVQSGAFKVPVDLDYIDAGTAVSPRRYDFDTIAAPGTSDRRTVTIENCGDEPIDVVVEGVDATEGAPAAWDVQPRGHRTLLPQGTLKLLVRFAPLQAGAYRATIPIVAGDQTASVELVGNATGPVEMTGFYACSCASPGRPAAGWPIVLAPLALRRRQRR